jgi:hypothetical protein
MIDLLLKYSFFHGLLWLIDKDLASNRAGIFSFATISRPTRDHTASYSVHTMGSVSGVEATKARS